MRISIVIPTYNRAWLFPQTIPSLLNQQTGEHTYDRFVATAASCLPGQITAPGTAPTTDSHACQIGYICKQRDND